MGQWVLIVLVFYLLDELDYVLVVQSAVDGNLGTDLHMSDHYLFSVVDQSFNIVVFILDGHLLHHCLHCKFLLVVLASHLITRSVSTVAQLPTNHVGDYFLLSL